ncbi:MAG: D-glycero-beta-D-manno-heptose 1,7-bisphosphate 7-phosphatase [Endozoicomonas sp.]
MNKLIILDRDGVINEDSDNYVRSVDEWIPIPGSIDAIARLSKTGFKIAVATNQSGIARGFFNLDTLAAMHNKMTTLVVSLGGRIHSIKFCPHGPDDKCRCRKPAPGLIQQIEEELGISAQDAWLIGDSLRDLQAAREAGCKPVLVKTGKGERTLAKGENLEDVPVYNNLAEFTDSLLMDIRQ